MKKIVDLILMLVVMGLVFGCGVEESRFMPVYRDCGNSNYTTGLAFSIVAMEVKGK